MDRSWDITELAAGNARGMEGGDPSALPAGPTAYIGGDNIAWFRTVRDAALAGGDLDTAAARLGVDVADLVKLRRALVGSHRRPGVLSRLFRRTQ